MRASKGFTLLELMIAILIFAMVSTAAYKLFDSVTRSQAVTDNVFSALDEIQRAQVIIEKDMMQIIGRSIRNEFGDKELAVVAPSKNGFLIEFTRAGWKNPLGTTRSDLQRVAYAFEEGELVRYYWPVLDRAPEPVLIRQVLLTDVRGIRLQFMDDKKMWRPSWPPFSAGQQGLSEKGGGKKGAVMPAGIEMLIQHDFYGLLEFTVPLVTSEDGDKNKQGGNDKADKRKIHGKDGSTSPFEDDDDEYDDDDDDDDDDDEYDDEDDDD